MLQAIDALREIFLVALLPDRKLRFFEEQPLGRVPPGREGDRVLLQFVVEDAMKRRCVPATQPAQQSPSEWNVGWCGASHLLGVRAAMR